MIPLKDKKLDRPLRNTMRRGGQGLLRETKGFFTHEDTFKSSSTCLLWLRAGRPSWRWDRRPLGRRSRTAPSLSVRLQSKKNGDDNLSWKTPLIDPSVKFRIRNSFYLLKCNLYDICDQYFQYQHLMTGRIVLSFERHLSWATSRVPIYSYWKR